MNGFDGAPPHRRQPLRRSNRPILLNGCSPHEEYTRTLDGSLEDESERSEDTSLDADSAEIDGCISDFSELSIPSSSVPWNTSGTGVATSASPWRTLSPAELARRARVLLQWRTQAPLRRSQSRLPAFGPTCRIPFLPTSSLRESFRLLMFYSCSPFIYQIFSTPFEVAFVCAETRSLPSLIVLFIICFVHTCSSWITSFPERFTYFYLLAAVPAISFFPVLPK